MTTIVSRQIIARQAEAAAKHHAKQPAGTPPPNPYCFAMEPEHHREWAAAFARLGQEVGGAVMGRGMP